jgi:hypothetical protein
VTRPLALSSEIIHMLHLTVVLTGSNWTAKLGIAAKLHLQWANSAAKSNVLAVQTAKCRLARQGWCLPLTLISFNIQLSLSCSSNISWSAIEVLII